MKEKFLSLYRNKRELTILQGLYLSVAIVAIVIAGLLALINQSVGVGILIVPLIAFVSFSMNTIAWALVRLIVESIDPSLKELSAKKAVVASQDKPSSTKATSSSQGAKKSSTAKASTKK